MIVEYFRNAKESDPLTGVDQKGKTVSLVLSLLKLNLEYVIKLNEYRLKEHIVNDYETEEEILLCLKKISSQRIAFFLYNELKKNTIGC